MDLQVVLGWGATAAVVAGSIASVARLRWRNNPKDKERRRRELVRTSGRVIEGYVTGAQDGVVHYSYHWRGVRYEASQDISDLASQTDYFEGFSGPVTVKFLGSRPSNSIIVCEDWRGNSKSRHVSS
ncbi:MAG TPA: hypothetical protein VEX68_06650 [Bryobacteraceae bacterium]|nr:hypothetical protein [Bryobacteraceae bacterium]